MRCRYIHDLKPAIQSVWRNVSKVFKRYANINTMSLLMAIIAAYISYRSLNESISQRESMYKPELFIGSECFLADIADSMNIRFYHLDSDSTQREEKMRPWYSLHNVGMGSAISVYGHLLFNSETMMSYFSKNRMDEVQMIKGDGFVDYMTFRGDTIEVFNQGFVSDWTVDYVLPISQSDEKSFQYFPPNVLDDIVKAYLWVEKANLSKEAIGFKIPIELAYKDINGKWYKKEFEMTVDCFIRGDNVGCLIKAGLSLKDMMGEFGESIEN